MGIPHIENNIPYYIIQQSKVSFLRIARSTLCPIDFISKATEFQSCKHNATSSSLGKIILAHPESFQRFSISRQYLLNIFSEDDP